MASNSNRRPKETHETVRGAPLEPIRVVERELTRPDGTKIKVQVPVYPPFQLASSVAGPEARRPSRTPRARKHQREGSSS
jgi:hypothetical protein